jgi:acetoacetate decarboxylase
MGKNLSVNASHEGRTFLEMELIKERDYNPDEIKEMNKNNGRIIQFGWRYIPKVGPFPGVALSEVTYYPVDNEFLSGSVCSENIKWTVPKPEQHPMQISIIEAIASLPILEYIPCSYKKGKSWMRMVLAHTLP